MSSNTFKSLTLALLFVTACADRPRTTEPLFVLPNRGLAAGRGSVQAVSLVVTVSDADVFGNAYNIRSDGQGVYTDGLGGVQAVLDQYGTFAFNTNTTTKNATRWVRYDFSSPVDPNNAYRPNPSDLLNYHFSTGASEFGTVPFIPIQNLGVGTSECIYMGNGFSAAGTGKGGGSNTVWGVSFHKGYENTIDSPTAFAVVTRTATTIWTIAPAGSCSPNSNIASLRLGDGTLEGYYNLPFFFTLTRK